VKMPLMTEYSSAQCKGFNPGMAYLAIKLAGGLHAFFD